MRTILNSMPDIVLQLDTNLKILWANKATLDIEPNAKGQVCYRVLHDRNNLCPDCPIVKALKTGQIERGIIHSQCISGIGESYWDDIGVPIKDAYGNVISIVKIARNITDIRRTEIEKRRLDNQYRLAREFTGQIHLLLTDVVMPKMKGRELAKNILIHHPKINCLFMSGYTADVITNNEVLDEDVYFIQKPFTIQDLADKVRQVMDG